MINAIESLRNDELLIAASLPDFIVDMSSNIEVDARGYVTFDIEYKYEKNYRVSLEMKCHMKKESFEILACGHFSDVDYEAPIAQGLAEVMDFSRVNISKSHEIQLTHEQINSLNAVIAEQALMKAKGELL